MLLLLHFSFALSDEQHCKNTFSYLRTTVEPLAIYLLLNDLRLCIRIEITKSVFITVIATLQAVDLPLVSQSTEKNTAIYLQSIVQLSLTLIGGYKPRSTCDE